MGDGTVTAEIVRVSRILCTSRISLFYEMIEMIIIIQCSIDYYSPDEF